MNSEETNRNLMVDNITRTRKACSRANASRKGSAVGKHSDVEYARYDPERYLPV